jgi:hypothetical protein
MLAARSSSYVQQLISKTFKKYTTSCAVADHVRLVEDIIPEKSMFVFPYFTGISSASPEDLPSKRQADPKGCSSWNRQTPFPDALSIQVAMFHEVVNWNLFS